MLDFKISWSPSVGTSWATVTSGALAPIITSREGKNNLVRCFIHKHCGTGCSGDNPVKEEDENKRTKIAGKMAKKRMGEINVAAVSSNHKVLRGC